MQHVPVSGVVLEPCSGEKNAIASMLSLYPQVERVITNDINPEANANFNLDAVVKENWEQFPECDWIVTNPPFNQAIEILENAYEFARRGVIFFIRQTFAEPTNERWEFLEKYPPWGQIDLPRYKFRKGKSNCWQTDSCTISIFIWDKQKDPQIPRRLMLHKSKIAGFYPNPEKEPTLEEFWNEQHQTHCSV